MNAAVPCSTSDFSATEQSQERAAIVGSSPLWAPAAGNSTAAKIKASEAWQDRLWRTWPREECWPAKMDIYEAAAYLRVSPDTIRRAVIVGRDGKARLAHQRLGSIYRIRKIDLDVFGAVAGRAALA